MSDFNDLIMYKALGVKFKKMHGDSSLAPYIEQLIDNESVVVPQIKNVCAKLSVELSDKLDDLVDRLGISKRAFIEACLIQGMHCAEHTLAAVLEGCDDE